MGVSEPQVPPVHSGSTGSLCSLIPSCGPGAPGPGQDNTGMAGGKPRGV